MSTPLLAAQDLRIIDAQVHIWGADSPQRPWPRGGTPRPHREQPWSADELIAQMDAAGVTAAVIVPPGWEGDRNDLALDAVRRYPGRFAVMGRIDPRAQDPFDAFARWREQPGLLGVRFTFHSERGRELLDHPVMARVWAAAETHAIPLMLRALPPMLPAIGELAQRHPALRIALDHLAIPLGSRDAAAFAHLPALLDLARWPNIALKATCLPAYTDEPFPHPGLAAPLRAVRAAFGARRMFWGSDLSRLPGTYRQCVEYGVHHAGCSTAEEVRELMGDALARWLGWPAAPDAAAAPSLASRSAGA